MANKWDDAAGDRRLKWLLDAEVSQVFRSKKWAQIPRHIRAELAPKMREPHLGSRCDCGEWDCGIHTPCHICGNHHSPGSDCY